MYRCCLPSLQVSSLASDFVLREITAVLARKIERELRKEGEREKRNETKHFVAPNIRVSCVLLCVCRVPGHCLVTRKKKTDQVR